MYISDISERTGLSIHTLRYYEKEGLLNNISRNGSGRRVYTGNDLDWVIWIQRLKSTGMSLDKIKQFSDLRSLGDTSISARKNMLIDHAQQLKADIQRLTNELDIVEYKIEAYKEKERLT
ncbi:MerR family transcriptional regulator [Alkalimarinus coralli]|uniref:MerR family transcriptional regulator n=1 Tax=Alkalimarinus coralli TaxID=2935863 RepID=UPI00202B76FB|nr:MerR family transcriptional regulator [Alkalimarinus coralli]